MIRSLPRLFRVLTQPLLTTSPQAAPPTEPPAAYTRKSFLTPGGLSVDLYIDLLWSGLLVFGSVMVITPSLNSALILDSVNVQGNVKAVREFTIMPLDAMIVLTGPSSLKSIQRTHSRAFSVYVLPKFFRSFGFHLADLSM